MYRSLLDGGNTLIPEPDELKSRNDGRRDESVPPPTLMGSLVWFFFSPFGRDRGVFKWCLRISENSYKQEIKTLDSLHVQKSLTNSYLVTLHDAHVCITDITSTSTLLIAHFFLYSTCLLIIPHCSLFAILLTNKLMMKTLGTSQFFIDQCLFSANSCVWSYSVLFDLLLGRKVLVTRVMVLFTRRFSGKHDPLKTEPEAHLNARFAVVPWVKSVLTFTSSMNFNSSKKELI